MLMPLILMPAAFAFFALALAKRAGYRDAFLGSALICGLITVLSTELLSLGAELNRPALTTVWALATLTGAVWLLRSAAGLKLPSINKSDRLSIVVTGTLITVVAAATAATALIAPPNNWDSMTYHLVSGSCAND